MFGRFIDDEKMYDWDSAYISQVLHSPVYAGHIIYEAKPTVSMKSKKRRYIPFEERAIVPNTHEAIIPQDRWENVQRILYSRSGCFMCDKTDYDNIFKGIVRCADCGRTMLVKVEHSANVTVFWIRPFIVAALIGNMVRKPVTLTTWKPVFCMKLSLRTFRHTQRPL